jgi:2-furoyl-CoA dehydrogenase large subunit
LDGAARVIIGQFFSALARQAGGAPAQDRPSLMRKLRALFGRRS